MSTCLKQLSMVSTLQTYYNKNMTSFLWVGWPYIRKAASAVNMGESSEDMKELFVTNGSNGKANISNSLATSL